MEGWSDNSIKNHFYVGIRKSIAYFLRTHGMKYEIPKVMQMKSTLLSEILDLNYRYLPSQCNGVLPRVHKDSQIDFSQANEESYKLQNLVQVFIPPSVLRKIILAKKLPKEITEELDKSEEGEEGVGVKRFIKPTGQKKAVSLSSKKEKGKGWTSLSGKKIEVYSDQNCLEKVTRIKKIGLEEKTKKSQKGPMPQLKFPSPERKNLINLISNESFDDLSLEIQNDFFISHDPLKRHHLVGNFESWEITKPKSRNIFVPPVHPYSPDPYLCANCGYPYPGYYPPYPEIENSWEYNQHPRIYDFPNQKHFDYDSHKPKGLPSYFPRSMHKNSEPIFQPPFNLPLYEPIFLNVPEEPVPEKFKSPENPNSSESIEDFSNVSRNPENPLCLFPPYEAILRNSHSKLYNSEFELEGYPLPFHQKRFGHQSNSACEPSQLPSPLFSMTDDIYRFSQFPYFQMPFNRNSPYWDPIGNYPPYQYSPNPDNKEENVWPWMPQNEKVPESPEILELRKNAGQKLIKHLSSIIYGIKEHINNL